MKRFHIVLVLILFLYADKICMAYDPSMQEKIDTVNNYQPLQFASQNAEILKNQKEFDNLSEKSPIHEVAYIETMKIGDDYDSESPIAKENLFANLKEKPFIGAVTPITNPSEFDDMTLEGNAVLERKRKPFFSRANWEKWKPIIKGEPSYDALLIGMQAIHTDPHRDERNNTNNMLAVQYGGVATGRFVNSWYSDTYFVCVSRRIWKKQFTKNISLDFQYKAGVMHGYKEHAPIQLGFIEPVVLPLFGLNYKKSGVDLWVIPSNYPVFAVNFRIGIPEPATYKSVHAKIKTNYEKTHPPKEPLPSNEDAYKLIVPAEKI